MADYPVTDIHISSTMLPATDNTVSLGPNGSVRAASNNSAYDSYNFTIVHSLISTAIKNSILSHYATHRRATFNYYCDMDYKTYACFYSGGQPTYIWIAEDVWHVQTGMVGH